jgi:hypothetical protein
VSIHSSQPISQRRPSAPVEELVESAFPEDLIVAASHGMLTEDVALALLRRRDLPAAAVEALTKNRKAMQDRKLLVQAIQHRRCPRHIALPLLRRLFPFELMQIALAPAVAADLKMLAEEALIAKLEGMALGERIALAKRASARVASALLLDPENAVIEGALQNSRMTESGIVKLLMSREVSPAVIRLLLAHRTWSVRPDIRLALLRKEETSAEQAIHIAESLPMTALRELIKHALLPPGREELIEAVVRKRQQSRL